MSQLIVLINNMKEKGAKRFFIKPLANNDNSKQQIYFGSDFDVIRALPSGDVKADGVGSKGAIFKASLNFHWVCLDGEADKAPNAQIIFYPKYPEIRLSGFLAGTRRESKVVPRHLMRSPTKEEREAREHSQQQRYLVLGFNKTEIWAYCTEWSGTLNREISEEVKELELVASVFYEYRDADDTSEVKLVKILRDIYQKGPIESCRLNSQGHKLPYRAQNGAGYTLEAQFGITPNGSPDPDFMDWELKAHSSGAVTLMTPEPTTGSYLDDLERFLRAYGTRIESERLDFASRHNVGDLNDKTTLTLELEGYDPINNEVIDPEGGLMLRDKQGHLAAGWAFEKLVNHWKNKHSNTCYVSYVKQKGSPPHYHYGPVITLAKGADLKLFLRALYSSTIYYDPGVNMKYENRRWKSKKRNQFRVGWRNVGQLYEETYQIDLRNC